MSVIPEQFERAWDAACDAFADRVDGWPEGSSVALLAACEAFHAEMMKTEDAKK